MRLFLLFGLSVLFSIHGYSCSINPNELPFCSYVSNGNSLVASGEIIKKIDRGYLIELREVYRGDETRCEIKVFERIDGNCNGIVFKYPMKTMGKVGQIILFTAERVDSIYTPENTWAEEGEYYNMYAEIVGFGQLMFPMVKKGNNFKGLFSKGVNSVKANKVSEELLACEVKNLLPQTRLLCGDHPLNIYPNPATDKVFIDQLVESYEEILLYDLQGKKVYISDSYDAVHGIPTSNLPAGLYVVVVKSGTNTFRQKLLIN